MSYNDSTHSLVFIQVVLVRRVDKHMIKVKNKQYKIIDAHLHFGLIIK